MIRNNTNLRSTHYSRRLFEVKLHYDVRELRQLSGMIQTNNNASYVYAYQPRRSARHANAHKSDPRCSTYTQQQLTYNADRTSWRYWPFPHALIISSTELDRNAAGTNLALFMKCFRLKE